MTDVPAKPGPKTPVPATMVLGAESAPFIHFDGIVGVGITRGTVQIELAARIVTPSAGKEGPKVVVTAHLRCSPNAALELQQAIGKALLLGALPSGATAQTKVN